jgi:hypothetical protein
MRAGHVGSNSIIVGFGRCNRGRHYGIRFIFDLYFTVGADRLLGTVLNSVLQLHSLLSHVFHPRSQWFGQCKVDARYNRSKLFVVNRYKAIRQPPEVMATRPVAYKPLSPQQRDSFGQGVVLPTLLVVVFKLEVFDIALQNSFLVVDDSINHLIAPNAKHINQSTTLAASTPSPTRSAVFLNHELT